MLTLGEWQRYRDARFSTGGAFWPDVAVSVDMTYSKSVILINWQSWPSLNDNIIRAYREMLTRSDEGRKDMHINSGWIL